VACIGERKGAYAVLVGRPEGKRPRRRWEYIKIGFLEVGWGGLDLD
jgi:hypothetical protein